jgi:hypothetical protein
MYAKFGVTPDTIEVLDNNKIVDSFAEETTILICQPEAIN